MFTNYEDRFALLQRGIVKAGLEDALFTKLRFRGPLFTSKDVEDDMEEILTRRVVGSLNDVEMAIIKHQPLTGLVQ